MHDAIPTQEIKTEDRLTAARAMLERASKERLSALEQYILQKAIGLFLLGERNSWGILHARAAIDGQAELFPKPRLSDDEGSDDACVALASLEQKGLLHFAPENATEEDSDILCFIAAIRDKQTVLLRNEKQRWS